METDKAQLSLPGVYKAEINGFFYIGGSKDIYKRHHDHQTRLRSGKHPNHKFQQAFNESGKIHITTTLIKNVPRLPKETPKEHKRRIVEAEGRELMKHIGKPNLLNLSERSDISTTALAANRKQWQDPEWKAKRLATMKERVWSVPRSPESREKMAKAKRGSKNLNARPIETTLNGDIMVFSTVVEAARYHGVHPSLFSNWLNGHTQWPSINHPPRTEASKRLVGLTGRYID